MAATLINGIPSGNLLSDYTFRMGMQAVEGKELSQKYGGDLSESVVDTFPSHLAPPGFWPQFLGFATCSFQLGCGNTR